MRLYLSLSLLFLLLIIGCQAQNNSIREKTIKGTIYVTGNMPFPHLTLKADNDSTYFLKCNSKTDSLLYANQGTKFEITYDNITDSAGIKILNVSEARLAPDKK